MEESPREPFGSILRRGAWFSSLPPDLQDRMLRGSVMRELAPGANLQEEGAPAPGMWGVLEGRVVFLHHVAGDTAPAFIHVCGPGFWFGEGPMLHDGRAFVTATAQTIVKALLLPSAEFERIFSEDPRAYREVARLALERYRLIMRYLAEARRLSADARLRLRLCDLAELARLKGSGGEEGATLALTQTELAGIIGLSRPKLNAGLRKLREEGFIEVRRGRLRVLDAAGLRGSVAGEPS